MGDLVLPTGLKTYGYDAQNRLTSYSGPGASIGYAYDANGNRTQQLTNATELNYEIDEDSNRIAGIDAGSGAFAPTYDANGSTTVDLTNSYSYNAAGRLVSANGVSYSYNGQGQRISKSASGSAVIFVYDESGQLLGEYDQTGATIQETIWLGNLPVAVIKPNGLGIDTFFVHADHLNTPRSIDDAQGQAVWVWDTITFGASQPNEDPHSTGTAFVYNLRHPGQYYDSESAINYNMARNYDATIGRYTQSDPIGLVGGINTYAYVASRPLQATDPLGLFLCDDWKWMAFDWALGLGSRNRTYGEFSDQAVHLRGLPMVNWARQRYQQKNSHTKSDGCCDSSKLQGVSNVASNFGIPQIIQATMQGNCAWHFIGSFRLDVVPVSCTQARFTITNNSSFTSFSYGVGPSWSSGPMGNFRQTYTWDENL